MALLLACLSAWFCLVSVSVCTFKFTVMQRWQPSSFVAAAVALAVVFLRLRRIPYKYQMPGINLLMAVLVEISVMVGWLVGLCSRVVTIHSSLVFFVWLESHKRGPSKETVKDIRGKSRKKLLLNTIQKRQTSKRIVDGNLHWKKNWYIITDSKFFD